jgi:AcrR family transcriptional regulator
MPDSLEPQRADGVPPMADRQSAAESVEASGASVSRTDGADETGRLVPIADPNVGLPPAAARILAAAREVLVTKGFGGLTLRAIAEESGENSAMVQYYFGNKAGLVTALIDSNFRDDLAGVTSVMSSVTGDDLLPKFVESLRTISAWPSFRVFFDVLPYALRREQFKSRMASVYDWYRQTKLEWLRAEDIEPDTQAHSDALLGFAELVVAVVDGLAIQKAIDDEFDLSRPYAVLEVLLQEGLPELLGTDLSQRSASSDPPVAS